MHFVDDGIRVTDSFNIGVENATVSHAGRGITVLNTAKTYISCAVINNFSKSGILLHKTQYSVITNVTVVFTKSAVTNSVVMYVEHIGIHIESSRYTNISSAVIMQTQTVGMFLAISSNIDIENVTITHSGQYGLAINFVHHITVMNTSITESSLVGITALNSNHIAIFNTAVMYAGMKKCIGNSPIFVESNVSCYGLLLGQVATATLYNIRVMYSGDKGIIMIHSSAIAVQNAIVTHVKARYIFIDEFQHSYLIYNN